VFDSRFRAIAARAAKAPSVLDLFLSQLRSKRRFTRILRGAAPMQTADEGRNPSGGTVHVWCELRKQQRKCRAKIRRQPASRISTFAKQMG
jgi:hypothetical protein